LNSWHIAQIQKAMELAGISTAGIPAKDVAEFSVKAFGGEYSPTLQSNWGGDKFVGGFGETKLYNMDYWTLRQRSGQIFTENMYARGIIRRLITNEINIGLSLECTPEELILGFSEDDLGDWSETVENRFALWGKNPRLCDHRERLTFGALQRAARMEAMISGDVLLVVRVDALTKLPRVQLVSGGLIQTPMEKWADSTIKHGVKLDSDGRHLGFYVTQEDGTSVYLPAATSITGRRQAWLLYGSQNRLDAVRGEPILSVILQSLKELDRYKDSAQRKAVINSMLAMFIKKTADKPGTLPISNAALSRGPSVSQGPRSFNTVNQIPGFVIEELQQGEEPVAGSNAGTDVNLGPFEDMVVRGMSWALEIPPEILQLSFSNNYSASQAAINEFKIYLNKVRTEFGEIFCQPVFTEFLISESLSGKITAPGFLKAWRDRANSYDLFAAWTSSEWAGAIKPSTDIRKQAQGYSEMIGEGWITNDRASRELTGTKFSKNIKKLKSENELKVLAATPLAEFRKKYGDVIANASLPQTAAGNTALVDTIADAVLDNLQQEA